MSLMEAERCELCEANAHHVEKVPCEREGTDEQGNGFVVLYCPCCDRWDRVYKAFAEQHVEDTVRQASRGLEE